MKGLEQIKADEARIADRGKTVVDRDPGIVAATFPGAVDNLVLWSLEGATGPMKLDKIVERVIVGAKFSDRERELIADMHRPANGKHIRQMIREGRRWSFGNALYREIGLALQRLKGMNRIRLVKGRGGGWVTGC